MKKWVYVLGIVALGFVIFNNVVQTADIIRLNNDLTVGFFVSLIAAVFYGIVNLK